MISDSESDVITFCGYKSCGMNIVGVCIQVPIMYWHIVCVHVVKWLLCPRLITLYTLSRKLNKFVI